MELENLFVIHLDLVPKGFGLFNPFKIARVFVCLLSIVSGLRTDC